MKQRHKREFLFTHWKRVAHWLDGWHAQAIGTQLQTSTKETFNFNEIKKAQKSMKKFSYKTSPRHNKKLICTYLCVPSSFMRQMK